jgi:hypothetical protein
VEKGVRAVTDVLIALLSGVVGILGGYISGVLRTLNEHRNERRDAALAEIFKEMSLFYRSLVSWTNAPNPDPNEPSPVSGGIPVRTHVNRQYDELLRTFYGNSIWLGKDTFDLIEGFVNASSVILNKLNRMKADDGWLPDGTNPNDLRAQRLTPRFVRVQKELRAEVEASRSIIPYRSVIRKNGLGQRRTDPGDDLRGRLEASRERPRETRESPVSPGPTENPTEPGGDPQEAREATQSAAETLRVAPEPRPPSAGTQQSLQRGLAQLGFRGRVWRRVFGR